MADRRVIDIDDAMAIIDEIDRLLRRDHGLEVIWHWLPDREGVAVLDIKPIAVAEAMVECEGTA
jgi:hypothetical protein